jgi:hypothetical protein
MILNFEIAHHWQNPEPEPCTINECHPPRHWGTPWFLSCETVARPRTGQRTASLSLFCSRPFGFVNRKMFSFRSNPALFMA